MLAVLDRGTRLEFAFDDLMRYHGPGSPGGVAHAYKVLERALPLLEADVRQAGEPDRETLRERAAHAGPIDEDTLVYRIELHAVGLDDAS